jgi:DNA-binding NtrC family response regulator
MYEQANVLIYGKEPSLLETRRQILRHGGFRVVAISQMTELGQLKVTEFQVFLLCHTLSPKDQQEAIAMSHRTNPVLQTIVMTAYAPEFQAGTMSRFISPFDGPEKLISQVRKSLERSVDGYVCQETNGPHFVKVNLIVSEEQFAAGWMYTGPAGQNVEPSSLSSETTEHKV